MNTTNKLETQETPVVLTPEQVVEQLRVLRGQIPNARPLTNDERELARKQVRLGLSPEAVQASVNAIGSSEGMAPAVGMSAGDVRQLMDENTRWSAVEDELKGLLTGVADANLARRQRTNIIAMKAFGIAKEVARDTPEVRPHVKEIKRLRALARRKKAPAEPPQTPSPEPAPHVEVTP